MRNGIVWLQRESAPETFFGLGVLAHVAVTGCEHRPGRRGLRLLVQRTPQKADCAFEVAASSQHGPDKVKPACVVGCQRDQIAAGGFSLREATSVEGLPRPGKQGSHVRCVHAEFPRGKFLKAIIAVAAGGGTPLTALPLRARTV